MKKTIRRMLVVGFGLLGTVLALYIGGYLLFICPVRHLYSCFLAGTLTKKKIIIDVIQIFFASTAGGGVWCLFDIIGGRFRDRD